MLRWEHKRLHTCKRAHRFSASAPCSLPCTTGIHQTWTRWLISPHYKGSQASYISKQSHPSKLDSTDQTDRAALISNTVRFLFSRLIGAGLLPAKVRQGVSNMHGIISCHYHKCTCLLSANRSMSCARFRKGINELIAIDKYAVLECLTSPNTSSFPQMSGKHWV